MIIFLYTFSFSCCKLNVFSFISNAYLIYFHIKHNSSQAFYDKIKTTWLAKYLNMTEHFSVVNPKSRKEKKKILHEAKNFKQWCRNVYCSEVVLYLNIFNIIQIHPLFCTKEKDCIRYTIVDTKLWFIRFHFSSKLHCGLKYFKLGSSFRFPKIILVGSSRVASQENVVMYNPTCAEI